MIKRCFTAAAAMSAMTLALAGPYHAGHLLIDHAHARPTVPGQSSGAAYISIENTGAVSDKLLTVSSPAAGAAEVHSMAMDGGIMRMREVPELELKPSTRVVMTPGEGYHIMLLDLKQALKPEEKIRLSLRFEKAGKVDIEVPVDNR